MKALLSTIAASLPSTNLFPSTSEVTSVSYTHLDVYKRQEYDVIKTKVDVNDLADYFILNHYIGKTDWPDHNWNLYRARIGADTRFKFVAWDNDSGLNKVTQNTTLMPETPINGYLDAPIQIFNRLTTNAEFRQVLIDRFSKHVVDPTGVLPPASCNAIYTELTGIVDQAVIAGCV